MNALPQDIHPPSFTILTDQTWATYERLDYGAIPQRASPPTTPLPPPQAYSQHDPRWAKLPLGRSVYTVTTAGCAVTSVAMLATVIDPDLNPGELVAWLNTHAGFTSGGLLHWSQAAKFAPGMEFINYHIWRNVPADVEALRTMLSYGPQIIQVDYHPGGPLNTHFVLATAFTAAGDDITIIDPWTAKRSTLLLRYSQAGWDLARAVYAVAEYRVTLE